MKVNFTKKQVKKIKKYLKNHSCKESKKNSNKFISKLILITANTGIGPILEIVCPHCKYREDITDIESW